MGSTFNRCSHWKAAKSSSTPSLAPSATHWRKSSLASDSGKSLIVSSNHGLLAIFLRRRQLRRLEGRGCAVIELYPSSKIYSIRRLSFFFFVFFPKLFNSDFNQSGVDVPTLFVSTNEEHGYFESSLPFVLPGVRFDQREYTLTFVTLLLVVTDRVS